MRPRARLMSSASIYILRCADGSLYTGITRRSVEERVSEHNSGLIPGFTSKRRPVALLFSETYERVDEAVAAERRIKGWSRAKKIAYIRGDFEALQALAKCRPRPSVLRQAQDEGTDGDAARVGALQTCLADC